MRSKINYLEAAQANEAVFRSILRDMKANRSSRPMGGVIPEALETEAPLEDIFNMYSRGNRMGKFTICDFRVEGTEAIIEFEDIAFLSGGGAELIYKITEEGVRYAGPGAMIMS